MNSQYLKTEIQAYLEHKEVLTNNEIDELLLDCLSYLDGRDKMREKFEANYRGILRNAEKQRNEAESILNGFSAISSILSNKNEEK